MKVSISLRGDNSDEYHIRLESWDRGNLPNEIIPLLEDADIIDVVLERVSGLERTSMHVLSGISEVIAKVFIDNSNAILYFYCDDMNPIPNMEKNNSKNKNISSQQYRSILFSRMFDRYCLKKGYIDIYNIPVKIHLEDRDIYIHLIAREKHSRIVNLIKETILGMAEK